MQQQNAVNPVGKPAVSRCQLVRNSVIWRVAKGPLLRRNNLAQIVVREQPDGGTVRIRDVARVELGSQVYTTKARLNGQPSAIIALYQLPGTNALAAADGVKKLMKELRQRFPRGLDYVIPLDTTQPVTAGIREMVKTLVEAFGLVILVVYLFLQSWRATLIPLLAVPVSLVGTFMLFPLLGFSINTLSLFGLVLAIGLVVDDAIVVVEAVERYLQEGIAAEGSHPQGDGGDHWPGDRGRAGAGLGFCPDGIYSRNHRAALSTVCCHDRRFGHPLRVQRADA